MKKINHKRLLTLTVFTLINGYSVAQISANANLHHHKSNTSNSHIAEITAPTPDAQTTQPTTQWETTDVLVRALTGDWYEIDEIALSILAMPSLTQNFMQGLLAIFANPTINPTPITEETSIWFESARQSINSLQETDCITNDQKTICLGLLPDATVNELFESAETILEIEPTYVNAAAKNFMEVVSHPYASIQNIIAAGQSIIELGQNYHKKGTNILLTAAKLPAITPDQIEEIAEEFILLDKKKPKIIAQLCHQLFNHPASSLVYKLHAAGYLKNLGISYYKQVAKKLNQLLDKTEDDAFIAMKIGDTFEEMGQNYYSSALNAFNKAATITSISLHDLALINESLARVQQKIASLTQ